RHRFDHSIYQVRLMVELPARVHRALKLDRVEPSYRFRDFLSYPAIGINCGVSELHHNDRILLTTTWMPRYQQPRIAPTTIKGVNTSFASLSADQFDPARLCPLVKAYRDWISDEERNLNPALGADNAEQAERERQKFTRDIASYAEEASRIELGIDLLQYA